MEREACVIHRETFQQFDGLEDEVHSDEALLDELMRLEEEEILALLATREEAREVMEGENVMEAEDVVMSDIDLDEPR